MDLNQVTLPVVDMEIATEFYRRMGFLQIVDTPHYARFECTEGVATFSLSLDAVKATQSSTIYFENEALDDLVAGLKDRGIEFSQEPTDMSYRWREAILFDPAGNKIKLYWAVLPREWLRCPRPRASTGRFRCRRAGGCASRLGRLCER